MNIYSSQVPKNGNGRKASKYSMKPALPGFQKQTKTPLKGELQVNIPDELGFKNSQQDTIKSNSTVH